jgi:uncharacterized DUF497 family protein
MVDFERVVGFEWDEGNTQKSQSKHGIAQTEAEQIFSNLPLRVADDVLHSQSEPRFHALGQTNAGRKVHVTFTMREGATRIRVISARLMNRKERRLYEEET